MTAAHMLREEAACARRLRRDEALREESTYQWITWVLTALNAAMLAMIGFLIYRCIVLIAS